MSEFDYITRTFNIRPSLRVRWILAGYRLRRWWRLRRMTIEDRELYVRCERALDEGLAQWFLYGEDAR